MAPSSLTAVLILELKTCLTRRLDGTRLARRDLPTRLFALPLDLGSNPSGPSGPPGSFAASAELASFDPQASSGELSASTPLPSRLHVEIQERPERGSVQEAAARSICLPCVFAGALASLREPEQGRQDTSQDAAALVEAALGALLSAPGFALRQGFEPVEIPHEPAEAHRFLASLAEAWELRIELSAAGASERRLAGPLRI